MNPLHTLAAALVAVALAAAPAHAGPGHDHDHGDAAPAAVGQTLPRFLAESETFELVGVLSDRRLTLYLDRFADNSPVRGAQIELEIAGAKFQARAASGPQGDDVYEVELPAAPAEGVLPVTATVIAGNETDLLAAEFDIHHTTHADAAAHTPGWTVLAVWSAGGLAALALLAWGGRRVLAARSVRAGGAA